MIRFIEERRLLDDSLVRVGDERDFGAAENAAFVQNGVAVFVNGTAPIEQPVGGATQEQSTTGGATEEVSHG